MDCTCWTTHPGDSDKALAECPVHGERLSVARRIAEFQGRTGRIITVGDASAPPNPNAAGIDRLLHNQHPDRPDWFRVGFDLGYEQGKAPHRPIVIDAANLTALPHSDQRRALNISETAAMVRADDAAWAAAHSDQQMDSDDENLAEHTGMREWSKHENATRTTCPVCHFETSDGYPASHAPDCTMTTPGGNDMTDLISDVDVRTNPVTTVLVAFQVLGMTAREAEAAVAKRLDGVKLLMQNDSTDLQRGTADPILTFAVLPVAATLDDSL